MSSIADLPASAQEFIGHIQNDLPTIIPNAVFGVYIHGSIAYGDFVESRSDIDIIAVLKRPLDVAELQKLRGWFEGPIMQASPWLKKLEMDFPVLATLIADSKYGAPATHFQDGNLDDMEKGVDGSNPIAWAGVLDCGITLYGPNPKEFVTEIAEERVIRAQKGEYDLLVECFDDWMRQDTWNQVYVITNLCRIAFYLSEKKIASKVAATKWCLTHVPEEHRDLMTYALDHIDNYHIPLSEQVIATLPGFVAYVGTLFKVSDTNSKEVGVIGGPEKRDITIADYDAEWPKKFQKHAEIIKTALGDAALQIEHIGSTSVPGLAAKPIIDILVVVPDSSDESVYLSQLESAGYVLRVREPDFHEHRMMRTPEKDIHIHIYSPESPEVERYILFRDQLRKDPEARKRYEDVKRQLASQSWSDMNAYAEAKTKVVEEIIESARNNP